MLPSNPDKIMLWAFTATVAILLAGAVGAAVGLASAPLPGVLAGLATVAAVALSARLRAGWIGTGYRYWSRLERAYARFARRVLIGIIHYGVMTPVARLGGSSGFWQAPAAPGWIPRTPVTRETDQRSWWRGLWARATGPGGAWVVALIPFLAALRLLDRLDVKAGKEVSSTMYTLY